MLDKSTFLNKYNIPEYELERLNIDWKVLIEIYEDYLNRKDNFEIQAEAVANILRRQSKVHTVRSRVKDPEHLIEKLIRKTEQRRKSKADGAFQFNKANYRNEITDLIGIRAIHIFKEDWEEIHHFIQDQWQVKELSANIREGDNASLYEDLGVNIDKRESGYRSIHYLIECRPTRELLTMEIQVRTIFEEGYGEIDHQLNYPQQSTPDELKNNLLILNRLTGSADEMASVVKAIKQYSADAKAAIESKNAEIERMKCEIEKLRKQIDGLEIEDDKKKSIQSAINSVEKSVASTNELYSEIIVQPPHLNTILEVTEGLNPLHDLDTSNIVAIANSPAMASIKALTDRIEKTLGKSSK